MAPSTTLSEITASPTPGSKRPATALLPAFEPLSSSPALPRPLKRTRDAFNEHTTYPTPVPTSSTHILTSSPSRVTNPRPDLTRTSSILSERTPLGAVPSIQLGADGTTTRMGRSSASCNYQLSANRLISRVHVEACYKAASSRLERDRVEITCTGWNGVKIHCKGQVYEVKKGETFSSDVRDAEIMLDVHDSRVVIRWPPKPRLGAISSDEEGEEDSPTKRQRVMLRHSTPPSPSPLQSRRRPVSPISPSPAVQALLPSSPPLLLSRTPLETVEIYEDPEPEEANGTSDAAEVSQVTQALTESVQNPTMSQVNVSITTEDFSDNDEENDPIIHSFGPFGANLLPRMASFTTGDSPYPNGSIKSSRSSHTEPLQPNQAPAASKKESTEFDVQGHIINQLAFSRLSSTPWSTILGHLPSEAGSLSINDIKQIVKGTACIGEVSREGKDAAGKPLESEYYYIPDMDEDEKRREAVVNDLRKPGLRACRKQHKQYFWRKPK
ncbi:target of SBF [Exophiala xenobiotica]|nr:target of SBF [Exophiala xenobiotica]